MSSNTPYQTKQEVEYLGDKTIELIRSGSVADWELHMPGIVRRFKSIAGRVDSAKQSADYRANNVRGLGQVGNFRQRQIHRSEKENAQASSNYLVNALQSIIKELKEVVDTEKAKGSAFYGDREKKPLIDLIADLSGEAMQYRDLLAENLRLKELVIHSKKYNDLRSEVAWLESAGVWNEGVIITLIVIAIQMASLVAPAPHSNKNLI